jgi:hypothetical protein
MSNNSKCRPYLKRLAIVFLICLVFIVAFNEITFLFQREGSDRAPQAVQIVIPEGTSIRLAAGDSLDSIPEGLTFVRGDILEVVNLDDTDHQLGPLWIPAGATASLAMNVSEKLSYSCSFSSSQYLNLDVREPTTLGTRITALSLAVPTLTALIFLYSLAALPLDKPTKKNGELPPSMQGT